MMCDMQIGHLNGPVPGCITSMLSGHALMGFLCGGTALSGISNPSHLDRCPKEKQSP